MGLSFLTPLFLAGLLALAVPIIVHLIHRERRDVVPFPSLMFLQRIPYRSVRRQRLRHLWLLFLRCLAVALLAAAFARPFFERRAATGTSPIGARELVILLDRSYSMGYGDRWTKAVAAARSAIDGIAGDDRATLVLFDASAEASGQPTSDKASLHAALGRAKLGSGATRYEPALALAQKLSIESERPRREVVLISDFQRVGWEGHEDVKLPQGTALTTVNVASGETSNVAVLNVDFKREVVDGRDRVTPTARLTNQGAKPVARTDVSLEVNGRSLETKPLALPAKGAATVTFAPFFLAAGDTKGTIRAGSDALPADNVFHFILSRGQTVSVLIVEPADAAAGHSLYLPRALAIGDQPPFRADLRREGQLTSADLEGRSLVVLNDAAWPRGEVGRRLRQMIVDGAGLLVASGTRGGARGWPSNDAELGPSPTGAVVDRMADRGGTLGYLDRSHPIFGVFSAPRSGDWASSRFYRYHKIDRGEGVLARYDDGAVALAERKAGKGRVLVWTSTLDSYWNDLPVQPVFLPFVHQLVRYAAGYSESRPWLVAGQSLDLAPELAAATTTRPTNDDRPDIVVSAPSGARERVAAGGATSVALQEQGFYEVKRGERTRAVAVNLDPAESDLSVFDPQEMVIAVAGKPVDEQQAARAVVLPPAEQERRQLLWWYLLAGVLLVLGAETLVGNRLSRV